MNNIFQGAKFGDKFLTRDGRIAIFLRIVYPENNIEYITEEDGINQVRSNGNFWTEGESDEDIVSRYQEPIDDKSVYIWFRNKTACGLSDAKNFINQLIKAIKHKPIFRTDSTMKLIYQEPIDEHTLTKIENNWYETEYNTSLHGPVDCFEAGYRKAKEE